MAQEANLSVLKIDASLGPLGILSEPLPLERVHVSGTLRNLTARITVSQKYSIPPDTASQAGDISFKYPLPYLGVVCDARIKIGDVEEVEALIRASPDVEQNQNFANLKKHISFESHDIILVQFARAALASAKFVEISFTYVTELSADDVGLAIVLPTTISPRMYKHGNQAKQGAKPSFARGYELTLDVKVSQFAALASVESSTHPSIQFTKGPIDDDVDDPDHEGRIRFSSATEAFGVRDLALSLRFKQSLRSLLPRCFLEHAPGTEHPFAAMLAFTPSATLPTRPTELIFLVDTAQQVDAGALQQILKAAIKETKAYDGLKVYINIVVIASNGTLSKAFANQSMLVKPDIIDKATKFVDAHLPKLLATSASDPKGKLLRESLSGVFALPRVSNTVRRQLVLFSTGQIELADAEALHDEVSSNCDAEDPSAACSGIFPVGLGPDANFSVLSELPRTANGFCEFIRDVSTLDEATVQRTLARQIKRAVQAPLSNAQISWGDLFDQYDLVQTPEPLPSFYAGDMVLVYGLLREQPEPGVYEVDLSADSTDATGKVSQVIFDRSEEVELEVLFDDDDSDGDGESSLSSDDESAATPRHAQTRGKNNGMLQDTTVHIIGVTERIFDIEEIASEEGATEEDRIATYNESVQLATSYHFVSAYTVLGASGKILQGSTATILACGGHISTPEEVAEAASTAAAAAAANANAPPSKLVYGLDFMLKYREQCLDKPDGLPVIRGVTDSKPRMEPLSPLLGPVVAATPRRRGGGGGGGAAKGHGRSGSGGQRAPREKKERKALNVIAGWENKGLVPEDASTIDKAVYDKLFRRFLSAVNKLTPENFDRITATLIELGKEEIKDVEGLRGVVGLVFEKGVLEPRFAQMHADLCIVLADNFPEFDDTSSAAAADGSAAPKAAKITFRRLLLNRCQKEFEGPKNQVDESLPAEEQAEKLFKLRQRALGNITFIGELFNKKVLSMQITLQVLAMLLGSMSDPPNDPTPDNLELANKLLLTSGKTLETQAKEILDKFMEGLAALSKNTLLESRIRFMLMGLVELRQNNWVLREGQATVGPKTIKELHEELRQKDIEKERELEESTSLRASGARQQSLLRSTGSAPRIPSAVPKQHTGPSLIPSTAKWASSVKSTPIAIAKKSQTGDIGFEMPSSPSSPARRPMSRTAAFEKQAASSPANPSPAAAAAAEEPTPSAEQAPRTFDSADDLENETLAVLKKFLKQVYPVAEAASALGSLCNSTLSSDTGSSSTKVVLDFLLMNLLERREEDRAAVAPLFGRVFADGFVTTEQFIESFEVVAENLEELVIDIPLIHKNAGQLLASCVAEKVLSLADLSSLFEPLVSSGAAYKIASFLLGFVFTTLGEAKAKETYTKSLDSFNLREFIKDGERDQVWNALLANDQVAWRVILQ